MLSFVVLRSSIIQKSSINPGFPKFVQFLHVIHKDSIKWWVVRSELGNHGQKNKFGLLVWWKLKPIVG